MNTKKLKFVVGSFIILGALTLLAFSGFEESKAYYQTVSELRAMGSKAEGVRIRVAGNTVPKDSCKNIKNTVDERKKLVILTHDGYVPSDQQVS